MNITEQDIGKAVQQLKRSERGRGAMKHVLDMLDGDGLGLDSDNQHAVLTIIAGAWRGYAQTARDEMREALGVR